MNSIMVVWKTFCISVINEYLIWERCFIVTMRSVMICMCPFYHCRCYQCIHSYLGIFLFLFNIIGISYCGSSAEVVATIITSIRVLYKLWIIIMSITIHDNIFDHKISSSSSSLLIVSLLLIAYCTISSSYSRNRYNISNIK